jgi:hypothetical protein
VRGTEWLFTISNRRIRQRERETIQSLGSYRKKERKSGKLINLKKIKLKSQKEKINNSNSNQQKERQKES